MTGVRRETILPDGGDDILIVTDLATLRVVSDPFRLRLFELLRDRPRTVKDLAAAVEAPITRLYYHVNLLEQHGLIRVESTRTVSGIVEKTYAASASRLAIDRAVLAPAAGGADEGLETLLAVVLDEAKAEIRRGVRAGEIDPAKKSFADGGLYLGRIWMRLSAERANELAARLEALALEFESELDAGTGPTHELLLGFYPTTGRAPAGEENGRDQE